MQNKALPDSTRVKCAIRPERIMLNKTGGLSLQGRIQESVYYGPLVRYRLAVEVENGLVLLTAEVPISQEEFQVGESVGIGIRSEDILVFAE